MAEFVIRPVTSTNWADFVALFEARGGPHYCWCTIYRLPSQPHLSNPEKKEAMCRLVQEGIPVGVLAYHGEKPVGWCSVAPRETYLRLNRSRAMPRVTPTDIPTWVILCFFVPRAYRGKGVSQALLEGAISCAQAKGAKIIEAYPFDTAGNSSTHRGHSTMFQRAGFHQDGHRWFLNVNSA